MYSLIQLKTTILLPLIALTVACLGLLPTARAQLPSPTPDGGYDNGNTAEGDFALQNLTTGAFNTALGNGALFSNKTGVQNTATGAGALLKNTASDNTASGAGALFNNTTGTNNTAVGLGALLSNIDANDNTAVGWAALASNTTGYDNTAVGDGALFSNTGGAAGAGSFNTAVGYRALFHNTGFSNTAVGWQALFNNTGADNTALGLGAGSGVTTANHVICIGAFVGGANTINSCYIGEIWNEPGGSQAVYVNSEGKLGYQVSSRRFKDQVKPMDRASEVIYSLEPVSFRYKPEIEPTRPLGFGLIAEDVEKVSRDLVSRGSDGKANSVRYDAVNAMLLNEFLKEHRKVNEQDHKIQEQEAKIAQLKSDFRAAVTQLTARLKEQGAQIQKASTQLQLSKPSVQAITDNP